MGLGALWNEPTVSVETQVGQCHSVLKADATLLSVLPFVQVRHLFCSSVCKSTLTSKHMLLLAPGNPTASSPFTEQVADFLISPLTA